MSDGGYDEGYLACPCFWGSVPGSLILTLEDRIRSFAGLSVLDVGCGEGKNSLYIASKGAAVSAYDVSDIAIEHARCAGNGGAANNPIFEVKDVTNEQRIVGYYDIVIAYGLFHCLKDGDTIMRVCRMLQSATKPGGFMVVCAFNDRSQDLSAHPGFHPITLRHEEYIRAFNGWKLIEAHDRDLHEVHPHNAIPHTHSMTRIIAQKPV